MNRAIGEVLALAEEYNVPILCNGDIFQKPIETPELVNWTIKRLSRSKGSVFSIPGQHDLMNHRYEDIHRTSYWTLCEAGVIKNVTPDRPLEVQFTPGLPTLTLFAFPWDYEPKPCEAKPSDFNRNIAMIHRYFWTQETGYPNAPGDRRLGISRKLFSGYDFVGIGDNHAHFISGNVVNNGCLMRRRADEMDYEPSVGLLRLNGEIERYKLDTSRDVYVKMTGVRRPTVEDENLYEEFTSCLKQLTVSAVDFIEFVHREIEKTDTHPEVRERIIKIVGKRTELHVG